jgi:hypothetical protein
VNKTSAITIQMAALGIILFKALLLRGVLG